MRTSNSFDKAKALANKGISRAPGTSLCTILFRETPCDSNFSIQKFNNSLTTGVLKRDEIIPTFKSFKVSLFTSYALF